MAILIRRVLLSVVLIPGLCVVPVLAADDSGVSVSPGSASGEAWVFGPRDVMVDQPFDISGRVWDGSSTPSPAVAILLVEGQVRTAALVDPEGMFQFTALLRDLGTVRVEVEVRSPLTEVVARSRTMFVTANRRFREIAAGEWPFTCALDGSGEVSCWGSNRSGQIGDGSDAEIRPPSRVRGITDAVGIAAGGQHACALHAGGAISCWGEDALGTRGIKRDVERRVPGLVSGITDAVQVAAGYGHSCALHATGKVSCWGWNHAGQLGNGSLKSWSGIPVNVRGVDDGAWIAGGDGHTCVLRQRGIVSCWGYNGQGQLGDGTTETRRSPVVAVGIEDAVEVAAGTTETCALRLSGGVSCWGGMMVYYPDAGEPPWRAWTSSRDETVPTSIDGITDAVRVEVGSHHCAVRALGSVRCWGHGNGSGELGTGNFDWPPDPYTPVDVVGLIDATQVTVGLWHTCALDTAGVPYCWGSNYDGEFGYGQQGEDSPTPKPVNGLEGD